MNRRNFLDTTAVAAAGALVTTQTVSVLAGSSGARDSSVPSCLKRATDQDRREAVDPFFRSYYALKDLLDIDSFALHWAENGIRTEDHVLGANCGALRDRASVHASFGGLFTRAGTPGRFSKFVHATGDMRYGGLPEFVDVPGSFFASGFVNVLTGGLISRYVDAGIAGS